MNNNQPEQKESNCVEKKGNESIIGALSQFEKKFCPIPKVIYQFFYGFFLLLMALFLASEYISFLNYLQNIWNMLLGKTFLLIKSFGVYVLCIFLLTVCLPNLKEKIAKFIVTIGVVSVFGMVIITFIKSSEMNSNNNSIQINQTLIDIGYWLFILYFIISLFRYISALSENLTPYFNKACEFIKSRIKRKNSNT